MKRLRVVVILMSQCVAGLGCAQEQSPAAAPQRQAGDARSLFNDGTALYEQQKFAEAADHFAAVAQSTPDAALRARAVYNESAARARIGQFERAAELARQAEAMTRDRELAADARYNLGHALYRQAQGAEARDAEAAKKLYKQAAGAFRGSLDLRPGDGDAARNLELARVAAHRLEQQQKTPDQKPHQDQNQQPGGQQQSQPSDQPNGEGKKDQQQRSEGKEQSQGQAQSQDQRQPVPSQAARTKEELDDLARRQQQAADRTANQNELGTPQDPQQAASAQRQLNMDTQKLAERLAGQPSEQPRDTSAQQAPSGADQQGAGDTKRTSAGDGERNGESAPSGKTAPAPQPENRNQQGKTGGTSSNENTGQAAAEQPSASQATQSLEQARREQQRAQQALARGDNAQAQDAQQKAADALRQAAQAYAAESGLQNSPQQNAQQGQRRDQQPDQKRAASPMGASGDGNDEYNDVPPAPPRDPLAQQLVDREKRMRAVRQRYLQQLLGRPAIVEKDW